MRSHRLELVNKISNITNNSIVSSEKEKNLTSLTQVLKKENWTTDVTNEMKAFEKNIVKAMKVLLKR